MPILKQLGDDQCPLGDFRHTMHVGRSGDAFGDTSFLSTRSGEAPTDTTSFPRSPRPDSRGPASLASSPIEPQHAESVMSFHVDLGPSMLGDILGVMDKEEDDLGFEEGKSSEGPGSPPLSNHEEEEEEEESVQRAEDLAHERMAEEQGSGDLQLTHPSNTFDLGPENGGPYTPEYTPEIRPKHLQHLDSCSMSSSGSAALDDKPMSQTYAGDTDSATFSAPAEEESNFSSFLEDEDDEIRV
uniref:CDC42 effector protein (Rho GTPase binding) 4a n=1 Tax=Neogobius melanostomus TaxID=47308 RepID=A0A8C6U5Y1_9GOBI